MPKLPRIYIDACPFIDMAKYEAKHSLAHKPGEQALREKDVWYCKKILESARAQEVEVYTSMISIAECTTVQPGQPSPPQDSQTFFDALLASGNSGVKLVQLTYLITIRARSLKWDNQLNLKGMDAIHYATALRMECDEFWTTDGRVEILGNAANLGKMLIVRASNTALLRPKYIQQGTANLFEEPMSEQEYDVRLEALKAEALEAERTDAS